METSSNNALSVALYSPKAQGFYHGELIAQVQQLCVVKGYTFSFINTRSTGRYKLTLGINRFDLVIVLRNAVHPELIEKMQHAGKAVVSIGFDYFPLQVPLVGSDYSFGVELAVNHLIKHKHTKLAFVGDISQFDIRKRYEAFCDQHELNGFELNDDQIIIINDTSFSGGFAAAEEFLKRSSGATGIIGASALMAIGFGRQLKFTAPDIYDSIEIVAFDALPAFAFSNQSISIVDQNLFLIAYGALSIAEAEFKGEPHTQHELVAPKLIDAESELYKSGDAFLATSAELGELHNPNYMKTVASYFYDWPRRIVDGNLDNIMMLEPLFPKFLHHVVISRVTETEKGAATKVIRHYSMDPKSPVKPSSEHVCTARDYPCCVGSLEPKSLKSAVHLPIWVNKKLWGVLSTFGDNSSSSAEESSFTALCGYLELIVKNLEQQLTLKAEKTPLAPKPAEQAKSKAGSISWNIVEATHYWDSLAMSMLGYESELEQHVYKHMELSDRVHSDDAHTLQEAIKDSTANTETLKIRLRHKDKSYPWFELNCIASADGKECEFKLSHYHD